MSPEPAFDIAEVTHRMVKGEEMAYRLFYDEYYDRLHRYLLVVTSGKEETTREALQSTLVRVVKHIRRFSSESEFWGWLTVLARSSLFDQTRKRKRYWNLLERFTRQSEIEQTADHTDHDAKLFTVLEQNLATLPMDEKELLDSKYLQGATVRELAAGFQTTEKAIESRLVRIRRKLKASLLESLKHESITQ